MGRPAVKLFGACSTSKFLVSRAGEVYDAAAEDPDRKFRFISLEVNMESPT